MPIVYLLRHAQSEANIKGILAGRDDSVNLSKFGQKQASNLVSQLENQRLNSQLLDDAQRQQLEEEAIKLSSEGSTMIDLDYRDAGERLKQRLTRLYGELPKAVHQRLMSIEIYEPAEPLQAP